MSLLSNLRWHAWPIIAMAPLFLTRPLGIGYQRSRRLDTDSATGLFNLSAFTTLGSAIVADCARHRQVVSLVVVTLEDFPEIHALFGTDLCRKAMIRIARALEKVVPAIGIAARTGSSEFALLFPGLSREEALARMEKSLGSPLRFEFTLDGAEVVLLPELASGVVKGRESISKAHDRLRNELAEFSTSERARLHAMTQQRERYARS